MKQKSKQPFSALKTLLLCGLILCGGFAVLSLIEHDRAWLWWFAGAMFFLSFYLRQLKSQITKQQPMTSVLPQSAKEDLAAGKIPQMSSQLLLGSEEKLLWSDWMRTDYYQSKPHLFYLSTRRLVCLDEDFCVDLPVDQVDLAVDNERITIMTSGKKLAFRTASPQSLAQAWAIVKKKV